MRNNTTKSPTSARGWALQLANLGFKVFPLPAGSKKPKVKWTEVMTTDPDKINGWFDETPEMNYGVCPGDNHVVVDLDDKDGQTGNLHFDMLEVRNSEIATFSVRTPSGGHHLYLKVPHPVSNAHGFPEEMTDIDVRGARGYVVGPGSSFEGKLYEVSSNDPDTIADAPDWLLGYLKTSNERDDRAQEPLGELDQPDQIALARKFLETHEPAIEGENGDDHTYATACSVKDFGISKEKCMELMLEWNDRCEPPWDAGELEIKIGNAYRYGNKRPGTYPGALMDYADEKGLIQIPSVNWDEIDMFDGPSPSGAPQNGLGSRLDAITYRGSEFLELDKRREMIAPGFLPAHGLTALLAKYSVGKTVIMVDLALRLALDMGWDGTQLAPGRTVIYCVGEDDVGVQELIRGWCKHHDVKTLPSDRFIVMDGVPDLLDTDDPETWAKHLRGAIGPVGNAIVFMDTWQRATAAAKGGQSDDKDMQTAITKAEDIAAKLNGPMILACHPPKAKLDTIMGSSVIENTTSAIWNLDKDKSGKRELKVVRIKGSREDQKRSYSFVEVGLSEKDQFGLERDSVVAQHTGLAEQEVDTARQELNVQAEAIREVLQQARASGETSPISKEKLTTLLSGTSHGEYEFPSFRQTKRILDNHFRGKTYEFEDGTVLEIAKHGRYWRCEIKLPDLEIPISSVTGGQELTADAPRD